MSKIPDLCHDIINCLNSVVLISGVVRDTLKDKDIPISANNTLHSALQSIEDAALKADKYLRELKSHLREKGMYE